MIPSLWVIVALGVLIAYVNGSNDVSKGIATLAGSGLTNYRRAILWGTVWTGLGLPARTPARHAPNGFGLASLNAMPQQSG
jgi:phosphate/sulfate permease